ncbi:MAG: tetratricopeptide repeat protein [Deltaproteobacteria bacterium]|nr:MAG: tetratricopeptide repeat protein [Deltaproteobacteria bacterium]
MELTQSIKERLRTADDWGRVIDEAQAEAEAVAEPSAQSRAFFELAVVSEDLYLDRARAMTCYQRAFKLDQSNLLALGRARRIFWEMGHLEMVGKLTALEIKMNQDPARAAELNYEYGRAMLNLGQFDTAKQFLEAAAAAAPENEDFQQRFQEVLYDRNNWQFALDTIYDQLRALTGEDDPLGATVTGRGRIVAGPFMKAARILQQESPEDPRLLPLLFKALDAYPLEEEAGFLAETLLAQAGHLQHIQKLQDRRASLVEDAAARVDLLRSFASMWSVRMSNMDMAAYFYRQALETAYGTGVHIGDDQIGWHIGAFRLLKEQAAQGGQADGLIPLAERGLSVVSDPVDKAILALLAGDLAWHAFQDVETARSFFQRAAELAPSHPVLQAFEAEHGALTPAASPEAEAPAEPTAEAPAAEEEPAAEAPRAETAEEAAPEAAAETAETPAEASEEAPAEASEEAPAEEPAAEAPAEAPAPAAAEEAPAAAEAAAEPPAEEAAPSGEPVELGDESFSPEEMALIEKAQAAEKKGGKRAMDAWREAVHAMPTKRYPRAKLRALYEQAGKWSNVAELIKDELKHLPDEDTARKTELYWELVRLYRDQLKQPGLVVTTLSAFEKFAEAQGDTDLLLEIVEAQQKQFESMKRWPDLIGRIRRRADLVEDPAEKVRLHLEAGNLFLDKFNNQAEAIKSFEAVLEVDPSQPEALEKLQALYARRRDWEKLVDVQQRAIELIEDAEERRERVLEMARTVGAKIKKPAIAIRIWQQVLDVDPGNLEALEHLESMQERAKDWPALAETLERLIEVTEDDAKKQQYLIKLGLLYGDKIGDPEAAIRTWETLHELDPNNRRAHDALKKLYLQQGDIDRLEAFYGKQEKWGEFVRVLEREVDNADPDRRRALLLKIADLYRDKLGKSDRAIRALEKAREGAPDDLEIAERLIALYEEAGDERHIAGPLATKLAHTEDPVERRELLGRLADLAERVSGDPAAAFDYFRQILDEQPDDAVAFENLVRLNETVGRSADLVASLEKAISSLGDTRESLPLRHELARLYEQDLQDLERALAVNQAILDIDPEDAQALASLERAYIALGRETDLLEVLGTKLSLAETDEDRRSIQARIGSIHEQLGNHDEAIAAYQAVLDTGVEDPAVLAALDRIYEGLERWEELAGILERELAVTGEEDAGRRAQLTLRLAAIAQDRLGDSTRAIELLRQVLDHDFANAEARERLERLLEVPEYECEVARILMPIYESLEDWANLVRCLDVLARAAEDLSERSGLLRRAGGILAQALGDLGQAFDRYAAALETDPTDADARAAFEEIAELEQRWQDVAALYEKIASGDLPADVSSDLYARLAALYEARIGDVDKAIANYERAVEIDPTRRDLLEALERLYQQQERWQDLLEVYRRQVDLEQDPEARLALRSKIAYLQEEMLQDVEGAIATYGEILADDPENLQAIAALERLYAATERWSDLADNLSRQLSLRQEPDAVLSLSLRLGELQLRKLDQPGLAVETYRRVLDLSPQEPTALAALEELLDNPDYQLEVARILEPIYRSANDWNKLIGVYEIMASHALEPAEKIRLLHQIGELYEILGDKLEAAFDAYARALKEDPANADTQQRLESLAQQSGRYEGLVELYEQVADEVVDDALKIQMLTKVAQLAETALADPSKAAATYQKILEVDPSNFDAIDALIEVHRRANQFDELVAAVVRKAEMLDDPDARKQLLLYAANIRDEVQSNPEGAIDLYRQVLAVDDADATALDALERILIQLERWEELKDVYQRKTELAQDPAERKRLLYVLGQVYERELDDVDRAIDTYQSILDLDPMDYDAIVALDRLYEKAERWLDQMQILERAAEIVEDTAEQVALRYRIGRLWETQLGDMVRAIESYRDVLGRDFQHADTIAALDLIAHGDVEPMAAAEVLAPLYEQLAEWDRLVDLYEVMAKHEEDPERRVERLHRIADIYERQLGEYDKAFDVYARALEVDPASEVTIEQLERLAEATGEWKKLADLLAAQVDRLLDPAQKVGMLLRIAQMQETRLGDLDAAVERYQQVLEEDPECIEALDALDRIYEASERWDDLVSNLRRRVNITGDEAQVIDLYFRIGQITQLRLGDTARALDAYREILNLDPNHGPTLQALELLFAEGEHQNEIAEILEPIYHEQERWDALVKLGETKLGTLEDPIDRLAVVQNVAEICEHKLGDIGEAYIWWLRAYMDDPLNEQVTAEMERLAEATQEWGHIVAVGEQILESDPSPEIRKAVLMRSAKVLDEHLHDYDAAVEAYRGVLEIDPDNAEALAALDRIYEATGRSAELAEILGRRIQLTVDPEQLIDLYMRLGQTYERDLGSPEQAISAYKQVLEQDPGNRPALERLEELFLAEQRWEDLFEVYQKIADTAHTDEEMADCYQRMAKIASDALDRPSDAIDLWARVLDLRGEDPLALDELARLYEAAGRWDELVEILERRVYVLEDPADKVGVYQTMGRVYAEHLDRERAALDAWLNALELDPTNPVTLEALEQIYETNQAWVELVDVLETTRGLGVETIGADRMLEVAAKIGRIQGEYLMQTEAAIEAWHEVLEHDPGNMEALEALENLYTQEARWGEAVQVLEKKVAALTDPEAKIEVLFQIAAIWEDQIGDKMQAAGAYMEILEIDPTNLRASEALEAIYRESEDWAALAELLITRAEVLEDRDAKVACLQSAAKVLEENLEDPDTAFQLLQLAFNEDYTNETTARELERLATETGKWSELLNEYNGLVQQIEDPMERCELWVKIGRWYAEHLQRPDYGIQALEKALELNPESVSALRELASFYRRGGDMQKLAETLARIVPLEQEPSEQASVLLELAQVQETGLGDAAAAIESYRRVLEVDPENMQALEALARLHEQLGEWNDLVAVLRRQAELTDDPDAALAIRKRIGEIQETSLADADAAIETYRDILASEPTDREALGALERLYLARGEIDAYLDILEAELDAAVDPEEQIGIYDKMARVLVETANDPERAAEALEKIVMLDPSRLDAYERLEELYRAQERWSELVDTYRRHADATEDVAVRVQALRAAAEVYRNEIEDVDRAIDTYREILSLAPDDFDAANTLSQLQERIEDWGGAIDTMGRLVELTDAPEARVELLTRMGNVLHAKLGDTETAELRLNQALEIDPTHVPAFKLLAEIYKGRGDWLKAARTLQKAAECSNNLLEKTTFLAEAGFIYLEELEEPDQARAIFDQVMELDPEHVKVGRILGQMYFDEGNYEKAAPILEMLTRKAETLDLDPDELKRLYLSAARAERELGQTEKALKQYQRAYDVDSTDYDVLSGMADLLFDAQEWDKAFRLYQTILVQHRDVLSDDETVRVYHRLGAIKGQQGEKRKALNYFEKALEIDPHHRPTLEAMIELQQEAGDWEGVISAKRALAEVAESGDEQFDLYRDIAKIYLEKIGNKDKAAEALERALEIKPVDYPALHELLDLYTNAKRWEDAVRILERIVEIEQDPLRRSRYNYTIAVLLRDELGAHDEAIDRFNQVLDDDPSMLKAFQAIDSMVTKTKDWKTLERSYRKMLKRLPQEGFDELKITLWHNLGEIYRSRLKDFKAAAAAFDVATKLDPDNIERHIMLAELYETLMRDNPAEFVDAAVRQHQVLIAHEPFRYASYHALFNIYQSAGQIDKAYCVAMVLNFLKKATPQEEAFFQQYHRQELVQARQRLGEEVLRRHVFHPDEDIYLTGILGLVAPAIAAWQARDLPPTIKKKERIDITADPSFFSRYAKYVKDVVNLPQPDVYLRPKEPGDLTILNVKVDNQVRPSMVVFQNLLRNKSEKHLVFALGRYMMDLYLPHYAYVVLDRSPQSLKQVFMACLLIAGMPVQGDQAALGQIAREITARMPAGAVDQIRSLIKKFVDAGGSTDVKRWAAAAELTNYRVGMLLCGDLTAAAQMISHEQVMLGSTMSPKDKIKELVLYCLSEDFFAARRAIGVHVG